MKKKLLVVLLAMAMVLCFAATALADDAPSVALTVDSTENDAISYLLGSSHSLTLKATATNAASKTEYAKVESSNETSWHETESNDDNRKQETSYVVKFTGGEYLELTSNVATKTFDTYDTSTTGTKTYKATLYKKVVISTKENTGSEWVAGTPNYTTVADDTAKVSVVGGLDSAYINRSETSTSSKIDKADLSKAADTLEIASTYSSYNIFYLHLTAADGFTIQKVGSTTMDADTTAYTEKVKFSSTRQKEINVIVKDENSNTITYIFTIKQLITPYLDDLAIKKSSTGSSAYTMYPSFAKDKNDYSVFIPYQSSGRAVYIDADPDNNSKAYYGSTEMDGRKSVTITSSTNKLTIYAVDEVDNTIKNKYEVKVYYASSSADDDADLDDLDVATSTRSGSGYKDATVSKTGNTYNVYVSKDQNYARITLDKSDRNAYIIYNDEVYTSQEAFSGLELKDGKNTFEFKVIAEDCETTETYTVNIYVGTSSKLANLTATGFVHEMTPDFDGDQNVYIGYVANKTSSTTITAEATDDDAKIYIYSETDGESKTGTGKAYDTFKLKEGLNNFRITVANSSSSRDYTYYYLSIYRQPAKTTARVSNQTVTVNGKDKDLYCYNINGNNFIQLRDFAYIMKGQDKQFNVEYTSSTYTASLTSGEAYSGERTKSLSSNITIKATTQNMKLDGTSIYPMAYNINGNNYIMLRDLCALLDISCTYSSTSNSIALNGNSSATYTPQN